jgi:hypothetical protein
MCFFAAGAVDVVVAFACSQEVSELISAGAAVDVDVAFACSQKVSELVSLLQVLLLMLLWHLPALRM